MEAEDLALRNRAHAFCSLMGAMSHKRYHHPPFPKCKQGRFARQRAPPVSLHDDEQARALEPTRTQSLISGRKI